jgi:hypothetical protein
MKQLKFIILAVVKRFSILAVDDAKVEETAKEAERFKTLIPIIEAKIKGTKPKDKSTL